MIPGDVGAGIAIFLLIILVGMIWLSIRVTRL